MNNNKILFLSWESPWPAYGGGKLRTLGLLREISKDFTVDLIILSKEQPKRSQELKLSNYVSSINWVPMKSVTLVDKLKIIIRMFIKKKPYHCSVIDLSFQHVPEIYNNIISFPGVVYASFGHWGTMIRRGDASNWILDQHNADVDFWRVYSNQASNLILKFATLVNWKLAAIHFPKIYTSVGKVVSVCEDDRQLTLDLNPQLKVHVIKNGVDCSYFVPSQSYLEKRNRLLFTGTSAPRNITALRMFLCNIWPKIRNNNPDIELLVAGNFSIKAQDEFQKYSNVRFTGWVEDIRPFFNNSDVYIAPFEETHGSKLKIAEAMAMGMPIVSTSEGIRGFNLVHRDSVLIAYDHHEFSDHVIFLLRNALMRKKLGNAARQTAVEDVDWKVLGKELKKIIRTTQERYV